VLLTPVGAHVPTAGGLATTALPYVDGAGAEVAQVFVSNPRGWTLSVGDPEQDAAFVAGCAERGVTTYVHASLLVNLGSPTALTVERSVATLVHALARGAAIGARGVVFHAGSAVMEPVDRALGQVRGALLPLLDEARSRGWPRLLVEPSAGGGRSLAARIEQLGPYLDAVDRHPWLGVCFDTCHIWAAGHDLAAPGGMTAALDLLVDTVGPDRLWLVHANDSRDPCGSTRDRHENVGQGAIGTPAFAELLAHPSTAGVPIVVETPTHGYAGHAADIELLRKLRPGRSPGGTGGARRPGATGRPRARYRATRPSS
jgi:deoxyribonuclease-4